MLLDELANAADSPITYLAERTDLYAKAEEWVEDNPDVSGATIPSPQRHCPTFMVKNNGQRAKAEQLYRKGISGARIHYHNNVKTPFHSEGNPCEYMKRRNEVKDKSDAETLDFLIGNHKHVHNAEYIRDRIVILDEFNPEPFLQRFPSNGRIGGGDHPGNIIPYFLKQLKEHDQEFPTETFTDLTDIVLKRTEEERDRVLRQLTQISSDDPGSGESSTQDGDPDPIGRSNDEPVTTDGGLPEKSRRN